MQRRRRSAPRPFRVVQRSASSIIGLGCLVFFGVLILALPEDIPATRAVVNLTADSHVVVAPDVRISVAYEGRGGNVVKGARAVISAPGQGRRSRRLIGVFESTVRPQGTYPAPPESRYHPPLLVRYRADPGVAMAELDYQLAARTVPLRTDLLLMAGALVGVAGLTYLRCAGPLRDLAGPRSAGWGFLSLSLVSSLFGLGVTGATVEQPRPTYTVLMLVGLVAMLSLGALLLRVRRAR